MKNHVIHQIYTYINVSSMKLRHILYYLGNSGIFSNFVYIQKQC